MVPPTEYIFEERKELSESMNHDELGYPLFTTEFDDLDIRIALRTGEMFVTIQDQTGIYKEHGKVLALGEWVNVVRETFLKEKGLSDE